LNIERIQFFLNTLKLGVFLYVANVCTPRIENENRTAVNISQSVSYHFTQIQFFVYDTGRLIYIYIFFFCGAGAQRGPWPPHS